MSWHCCTVAAAILSHPMHIVCIVKQTQADPQLLVPSAQLRRPGLFRWPVQLELLEPSNVVDQLLPADEYEAPIDHGWAMEQGMTIQELVEATGRWVLVHHTLLDGEANTGWEGPAFEFCVRRWPNSLWAVLSQGVIAHSYCVTQSFNQSALPISRQS